MPLTAEQRKRIRDRNRRFAKMSPKQQRITIAKDVIKQLGTLIFPTKGVYFSSDILDGDRETELQESLENAQCHVCAIGAVFVAAVKRANNLKLWECPLDSYGNPYVSKKRMLEYLRPWFPNDEMKEMELAFENWVPTPWQRLSPAERMRKIMENVIANGGTFVSPEIPAEDGQ